MSEWPGMSKTSASGCLRLICSLSAPNAKDSASPCSKPCRRASPFYRPPFPARPNRSEEHTSELQSQSNLLCRLLLEKTRARDLFFFNDTATTEIYTLSLHAALPISPCSKPCRRASPFYRPPFPARPN